MAAHYFEYQVQFKADGDREWSPWKAPTGFIGADSEMRDLKRAHPSFIVRMIKRKVQVTDWEVVKSFEDWEDEHRLALDEAHYPTS